MNKNRSVEIRPAAPEDMKSLLELLEKNNLPLDGLIDHLATTLVAGEGQAIVGGIALELYGGEALLRSAVVDEAYRGIGLGQHLTQAALDLAGKLGVKEMYLLTETAGKFFPRFGFKPVNRSEVPDSVQESVEFRSACPVSALVMRLSLNEGHGG